MPFDLDRQAFAFVDFETTAPDADVTVVGTANHVLTPSTKPVLLAWAIGDAPVQIWDYRKRFPAQLRKHVEQGGFIVAWSAQYERWVWQQICTPELGWPELRQEQVLDAMVQAAAANLPPDLDGASKALGFGGKTIGGKGVMKEFARALDVDDYRKANPEKWQLYCEYNIVDVEKMRRVFWNTRLLSHEEWQDYWCTERINDRGLCIDPDLAKGASAYRDEEAAFVDAEIQRLSGGLIRNRNCSQAINAFVYGHLPDDLRPFMVKEKDKETGEPKRFSLDKNALAQLIEEAKQHEHGLPDEVMELLELIEHGRSNSALKFAKALAASVPQPDGTRRLLNQYVTNGAGQTGRQSSRGTQIHNLIRARLGEDLADRGVSDILGLGPPDHMLRELTKKERVRAIEQAILTAITAQVPIERLRLLGPVSKTLAKAIRPLFQAAPGRKLVWGDWSAIEVVICAWLSNDPDAQEMVLDPIATGLDIYRRNAVMMALAASEDDVPDKVRQSSKVSTLALQFCGGEGALRAMGRSYGIRFASAQARDLVDRWRGINPWAKAQGSRMLDAAWAAMKTPEIEFAAGRVAFSFLPRMMGGTLFCWLPDGRPLAYPQARIELYHNERFERWEERITYAYRSGRKALWPGLCAENATQGTAASLLRHLIRVLDPENVLVGSTHDELILEVPAGEAQAWAGKLQAAMTTIPSWLQGCPVRAEITIDDYYHK